MNNEIKEILDFKENADYKKLSCDEIAILKDYIINLQKENKKLKSRIEKAVEYGNNCLENLKEQENYICESIDVVELLKMIHKNYINILNGKE